MAGIVLVAVLSLGVGGCRQEPALERFPYGELSIGADLVLVPDRNWSVIAADPEATPAWEFRGSATLRCRILREPEEPLNLSFDPAPESAGYRYLVTWDGEPISEEITVGPADDPFQVTLSPEASPPEWLAPGDHVLEIHRRYVNRGAESLENRFEAVAYRWGEVAVELAGEELENLRYLADFLSFGVTGVGVDDNAKVTRGGWLFQGPQRESRRFQLAAEGFLHLRLENASQEPAVFLVEGGGESSRLSVPPGESRPFRRLLAAGSHSLTFAVEGASDGLFLWGEGFLGELGAAVTPVVLVTLDTTRRDALGAYNDEAHWTPELDAFAAKASVYENAYSTAPWTLPSHASMMTGLYPSRHGAGVSAQFLPRSLPTLAGLLRQRGYFSGGFIGGKLCSHNFGVGQGFHHYRDPDGFETLGGQLTEYLQAFLGTHRDKPLFLFANYFDPHALYKAPKRFERQLELAQLQGALEGHPVWSRFMAGDANAWRAIIDGEAPATPQLLELMQAAYRAEVAFMDEQLGLLFEALRQHGLFERALIILVADHGELLGEHGLFSHAGRLDPELTEIPMIVKYPGQTEGERIADLVSHVDLFSTVLRAVGVEPARIPDHDGHPLPWTSKDGRTSSGRRTLFLEEHESRVHPLPPRLKLGPRVYGVQRPLFRQIVWSSRTQNLDDADFAAACAQKPEGSWRPSAWEGLTCEIPAEALYRQLERRLGALGEVENAGVLTKEQEDALKALGYL